MAEIRLENIKKKFDGVTAVKDLSLTINDGEFFTFVGPSGCGKSTVLNMIAGLEDATEGSIYFDGRAVNDLSPKERDVAMVFQSYALYPHMNVYDNIAFPLKIKKTPAGTIESEVKRVSSVLGLEDLLRRKPGELSGGQRQRVALGRAIVRRPKVFLMDEPLSNLDARLRVEMRAELKRLHRDLKITTVYVTHDQAEAMSLSDRIAVMKDGAVQQCGTSMDVYRRPANIFVAGFMGNPTMNFIPATVKRKEPLEIECFGFLLSPRVEKKPEAESVVAGIRPEEVTVSLGRTEGSVEGAVILIEPAGSWNWVDVHRMGVTIRGTSAPDAVLAVDERAYVTFPSDKVVIFDPVVGERL